MTFINRLAKSVSGLFKPSATKTATESAAKTVCVGTESEIKMHQTVTKLAKAYTPMIKFVGGRHPIPKQTGPMHSHPCAVNGLIPGSKDCVPVADFLSKLRPFVVVPFKTPGKAKAKSPVVPSSSGTNGKYVFANRPLEEDEVSSISQLPARFRYKPIDELESEAINGGGAL